MSSPLFPHGILCRYREFELELVERGASRHPDLLTGLCEEVFTVAARSRGWEGREALDTMRHTFKIGPLFQVDALALIRRERALVGLMGAVSDWQVDGRSIVHLCSLGLLPEAQNRGFLHGLLALLWILIGDDEHQVRSQREGRTYVSAITQSPYIIAFLNKVFDTYPSPERSGPDAAMTAVAHAAAERFAPGIRLDPDTFVLRNECQFRYHDVPWSLDKRVNRLCRERLRFEEGDVFAVVGRVDPVRLAPFVASAWSRYPDLLHVLADRATGARVRPDEILSPMSER